VSEKQPGLDSCAILEPAMISSTPRLDDGTARVVLCNETAGDVTVTRLLILPVAPPEPLVTLTYSETRLVPGQKWEVDITPTLLEDAPAIQKGILLFSGSSVPIRQVQSGRFCYCVENGVVTLFQSAD
jgi:hypothetical protein